MGKVSILSGTTEPVSICGMRTTYSGSFKDFMATTNLKGVASVYRLFSGSFSVTEGACGRRVRLTRGQRFISPWLPLPQSSFKTPVMATEATSPGAPCDPECLPLKRFRLHWQLRWPEPKLEQIANHGSKRTIIHGTKSDQCDPGKDSHRRGQCHSGRAPSACSRRAWL